MRIYIYSGACSECAAVLRALVVIEGERALETPLSLRCDNYQQHETGTSELVHLGLEGVR